jgi:predicted GTPase
MSEEFAEQLQQGRLADALTVALTNAIELEITTWLAIADAPEPKLGECLHTKINIVDGEIDNQIGSQCLNGGSYKEIKDFHQEQVQYSSQMIQYNLETLQQLLITIAGTYNQVQTIQN